MQLHALLGGVHRDAAAVGLRKGRRGGRVFIAASARVGGIPCNGRRRTDLEPQIRQAGA